MHSWVWAYKKCLISIAMHSIVEDKKQNKIPFLKETTIYLGIRGVHGKLRR